MSAGKLLAGVIVVSAVLGGVAMYYLQVYGYYEPVEGDVAADVVAVPAGEDTPVAVPFSNFEGIDAASSPIRYRACFDTELTLEAARARFQPYPDPAPRVAPGWFDCFDAEALGAMLADGRAAAFMGTRNLEYGIDRVFAITEDGRGYIWHDVNECGDKLYDGSPADPSCPPNPNAN